MILNFLSIPSLFKGQAKGSVHTFTANSIEGKKVDFSNFKGKRLLIVNTASKCGLTPQFKDLEELHKKYKDKNLVIIGFPSNDFAEQDPGNNEEIKSFCERNYGVSFLMMEKINVTGNKMHPIYKYLTSKEKNGVMNSRVRWNFQKYLVNEDGQLIDWVSPWRKPDYYKIIRWLNK